LAVDVAAAYERYGPMVLRRCRALLGDENAASDAMQDVFVQLLRYRERLEDRGLSSLLYTIATNVCLKRLRGASRRPETPAGEMLVRIAQAVEAEARSGATLLLARLFSRTPVSTQTMAVLHYLDGLTLEEVAEEVGMSVSGVRKRLRALQAELQRLQQGGAVLPTGGRHAS
jgi:RNA polymerase sigma-70 factor (ECF subfamily)